jgi:hypothetical protein
MAPIEIYKTQKDIFLLCFRKCSLLYLFLYLQLYNHILHAIVYSMIKYYSMHITRSYLRPQKPCGRFTLSGSCRFL